MYKLCRYGFRCHQAYNTCNLFWWYMQKVALSKENYKKISAATLDGLGMKPTASIPMK